MIGGVTYDDPAKLLSYAMIQCDLLSCLNSMSGTGRRRPGFSRCELRMLPTFVLGSVATAVSQVHRTCAVETRRLSCKIKTLPPWLSGLRHGHQDIHFRPSAKQKPKLRVCILFIIQLQLLSETIDADEARTLAGTA